MQAEFNQCPQIDERATKTFKEKGHVIIDNLDGKFQNYFFSLYAKNVIFKQIKGIQIEGLFGEYNYIGMVNKDDQPHGWGRAIAADKSDFIDLQFKDGVRHGFYRCIA